jgi:hypothetical protein
MRAPQSREQQPARTRRPRARLGLPWLALSFLPLIAIIIAAGWSLRPQASPKPAQHSSAPTASASVAALPQTNALWKAGSLKEETDALLADPASPTHLLAGTYNGIWESTDGGTTWKLSSTTPHGVGVMAFAAQPDGSILYAGGANGVVYAESQHAGTGWHAISHVLGSGNPIFSLAAASNGRAILLAGTVGGLYRGVEQGAAWQWKKVADSGDSSVPAITWVPWQPDVAYAAIFGTAPAVLRTADSGLTWKPDTRGLPTTLPAEAFLAVTTPQRAIVLSTMGFGVWRRTDDGTWTDVSGNLPEHHGMPLTASSGSQIIYTGTMGSGVFDVRSNASTWHLLGKNLLGPQYIVLSLTVARTSQPRLIAGTSVGVFSYPLSG